MASKYLFVIFYLTTLSVICLNLKLNDHSLLSIGLEIVNQSSKEEKANQNIRKQ